MEVNLSSRLRVLEKESSEPSKIIVVSSAYCESLHSVAPILILRTSLSFLTALTKISAHKIKRYGESGHPGGGDSHMEQKGMLVGNFEFNP